MNHQSLSHSARSNFVKRVYSVLSVQLAATFLMVLCHHTSPAFARFQFNNMWLFWTSFAVTIGTMIALCTHQVSQSSG